MLKFKQFQYSLILPYRHICPAGYMLLALISFFI